jgi:hypothetical protein
VSRALVGIRAAAWPYLAGPYEQVAWDEIARIERRAEGPTRMVPGSQGFMATTMPNGDLLIWVSDDVDRRFEVSYAGPLKSDPAR